MLTVEALNLEGDFIHDHIQDRTCRPLQEELWKAQFPVRYGRSLCDVDICRQQSAGPEALVDVFI